MLGKSPLARFLCRFFLCAFFVLANLPLCAEDKPSYGDTLVDSSIGDASKLNPILLTDSASGDIVGLVFNGLVKYDKDLHLVGDLAKSWKISSDGLTITFYLRQNVRWHDGQPFTAEDVKFTWDKLVDPKTQTPYASSYILVKRATILEKYTFQVEYSEPFAPALDSWGIGILPKHILENQDINTSGFNRKPIGTGPFKFKEWKTAEKIELEVNKDYFEGRAYLDRYAYRVIPDQSAQFLSLQKGEVDQMTLTPDQFTGQETSEKGFLDKFHKFKYPSLNYIYMGFNLKREIFQDRRVRVAIAHAINKDDIIQKILHGLGHGVTGPYPTTFWAYNYDVKPYSYDLKESEMLLSQAGWKKDKSGKLVKDGKVFEFNLMTNQGNQAREQCATIIQQQLAKLGIQVNIRILAWTAFMDIVDRQRNFDSVVLGWSLGLDPDCYDIWHSSKTGPNEYNFISYKNSKVDQLLLDGRKTFDQEKRKKIYNKIHELIAYDEPYVFLYVPDNLVAIDKRFRNIKVAPLGISYNFIRWYVPKSEIKYAY